MFFYTRNLAKLTIETGVKPWEWPLPDSVTQQIRHDKRARQDWYRNAETVHYFYTSLEASNPNMRPSKENPPRLIHALTAEYDVKIPKERIDEAIKAMPIKPAWVERSLGGNVRLSWPLERPLVVESYDFCCFVLEAAIKWLNLDMLPAFDEGAFTTPTRLLCNGCEWTPTGHPPIGEKDLQAFFVAVAKKFRFNGAEGGTIPLDVVEPELRKLYPSFNWPADFLPDTQGPTFWIPESTSPLSAILKPEGFITFSAHATKPFYSWADLLGPDFVKGFRDESIAKATSDIFWDSKRFWRKKNGQFISLDSAELTNYFKVNCRLSAKPSPDGTSVIDVALNHIYNENFVTGAAPFVFRPAGLLDFQGKRILNTYVNRPVAPAEGEPGAWGEKFGFIAALLDNLFMPKDQLPKFLGWWKYFYACARTNSPAPGQNIFLMGGVGIGKTLLNRHIIGTSVGGHVDASKFLIEGGEFNSELFDAPLWCVDDETAGESESTRNNFSTMLKKCTANATFRHNKKFEVATMLEWMGRICTTTNLDYVSSRLLGSMDNSSQDKTSLFKCAESSTMKFPGRAETIGLVNSELPHFLAWLQKWEPPADVLPDSRFGVRAHHEGTLLQQAQQSTRSTPFKELLVESLLTWFESDSKATEWRGTAMQVIRLVHINPLNDSICRTLKLEQTARYLADIQREGKLDMSVETGERDERIWIFKRLKNNEQPKPTDRPA